MLHFVVKLALQLVVFGHPILSDAKSNAQKEKKDDSKHKQKD